MRDWSDDGEQTGPWLRAEILALVAIQLAGVVALIGWLLS